MKRKSILIVTCILATSLILGISAYGAPAKKSKTNVKPTTTKTLYKDGSYDAIQKSANYGFEEATIVIKNGKIQGVTLKRLGADKAEIDYTGWDGTSNKPNLKKFRIDLAKTMLVKQSPKVDTITGATDSSNGWIKATTTALKQATK